MKSGWILTRHPGPPTKPTPPPTVPTLIPTLFARCILPTSPYTSIQSTPSSASAPPTTTTHPQTPSRSPTPISRLLSCRSTLAHPAPSATSLVQCRKHTPVSPSPALAMTPPDRTLPTSLRLLFSPATPFSCCVPIRVCVPSSRSPPHPALPSRSSSLQVQLQLSRSLSRPTPTTGCATVASA